MSQRSQVPAGDAGQAQPGPEQQAGTAYRFAWLSLLLLPFSLVGAFLLGDAPSWSGPRLLRPVSPVPQWQP